MTIAQNALNLIHRVQSPSTAVQEPFPTLILVHGWTGDENSAWVFRRALPPEALVISPRGPIDAGDGYGWRDRHLPGAEGFAVGLEALQVFVQRLPEVYAADLARVTLVGFSQGAAICCALALTAPELVKGVAMLSGYLPPFAQAWGTPGKLTGKAFFIAHGTKDTTVPEAEALAARAVLAQAGAEITYRTYPVGHKMDAQGLLNLKTWLAAHV